MHMHNIYIKVQMSMFNKTHDQNNNQEKKIKL